MIEVQWYAGSRGEETPRLIKIDDEDFRVDEILDRALVFDKAERGYHWQLRVRCGTRFFILTKRWDEWSCKEE